MTAQNRMYSEFAHLCTLISASEDYAALLIIAELTLPLCAEDTQGAKALREGHPHLEWTDLCGIEVYESIPLPM